MNVEYYFDDFKMICKVHNDWHDGGDSAQRMGAYHALNKIISQRWDLELPYAEPKYFLDALNKLEAGKGNYVRHPDKRYWYSDWDRCSRDQLIALLVGMSFNSDVPEIKTHLKNLFVRCLKRGLLFANNTRHNGATKQNHGSRYANQTKTRNFNWKLPDILGPDFLRTLITAICPAICRPLFWTFFNLLDLETLINLIIKQYFKKNDNDVNNLLLVLLHNHSKCPTIVTLICAIMIDIPEMHRRLSKYYTGGDPEFFVNLYKKAMYFVCK